MSAMVELVETETGGRRGLVMVMVWDLLWRTGVASSTVSMMPGEADLKSTL